MRKLTSVSAVLVLFLCLLSCSKDSTSPSAALVAAPEADATEDSSSGGVYKGAFVGSSGVVKITLQKGKAEVVITMDGVTKTLTTTALANWKTGQAVANVDFTNGDWKATFNVSASGSSPTIIIVIPGHTITPALLKEKSTALIRAYEGSYAGTDSGTWNFILREGQLLGVSRSSTGSNGSLFEGTVSGSTISISGVGAQGVINGDNVSGTWVSPQSPDQKGTWTGKRTL